MYIETEDSFDPAADFQAYTEASPRAREWDELMRGFQVQVPGAKEGEWWASMEEAFDIDWFQTVDLITRNYRQPSPLLGPDAARLCVDAALEAMGPMTQDERSSFLGGNARRFYRL